MNIQHTPQYDLGFIERVCQRYGGFSFISHQGQEQIAVYQFTGSNPLQRVDGVNDKDLTSFLNEHSDHSLDLYAGYQAADQRGWSSRMDVYVFNTRLADEHEELQALLTFHEVCHHLEIRKSHHGLTFLLPEDKAIGKIIEAEANMPGPDPDHNQDFGAILASFMRRHTEKEAARLLELAMSKTFLEMGWHPASSQ